MNSVSPKTALLLNGWYTPAQLTRIAETGEDSLSTSDEPESMREARATLARSLRSFLLRSVDLAEAFGIYSPPHNAAGLHRVRIEEDRVTGIKFAEEV